MTVLYFLPSLLVAGWLCYWLGRHVERRQWQRALERGQMLVEAIARYGATQPSLSDDQIASLLSDIEKL